MSGTSESTAPIPEQDPRVYFAAERTLLAWVRTGLALMGLGFAIARFGLFLREMQTSPTSAHVISSVAGSAFTGIALIVLGILVNIAGAADYIRTIRQLSVGVWIPGRVSKLAVGLATLLAILGATMAIHLFLLP